MKTYFNTHNQETKNNYFDNCDGKIHFLFFVCLFVCLFFRINEFVQLIVSCRYLKLLLIMFIAFVKFV